MLTRNVGSESQSGPDRDAGIELFRFVMAMLVILLHILPVTQPSASDPWGGPYWLAIADTLCRCAVPFFFILSGYYYRPDRSAVANLRRAWVRLTPIYLFWFVCYLGVAFVFPDRWPDPWRVIHLFDGGPGFHLWFLPALIFALTALTVSLALGGPRLAVAVAALLAVGGPILLDYHALASVAPYSPHLSDIRRQLAAPAFVVIGYLLRAAPALGVRASLSLCLVTYAGLLAERHALIVGVGDRAIIYADGLIGTFCFGAAVFLLARSLNPVPGVSRAAGLGALGLPIYLSHIVFLWGWQRHVPAMPARTLVLFALIAGSATVSAMGLIRIGWLRRFTT